MKKIIALLILVTVGLSAQYNEPVHMFSAFKFETLAGVNFSSLAGGSVILEGKTNLTPNLNLTLSIGYSKINKKVGYNVNTYWHVRFNNIDEYTTDSYNISELNYDVFPLSLGFEYFIQHNVFSPYALIEFGYNAVEVHQVRSGGFISAGGTYSSYDQLPSAFKSGDPSFSHNNPYRIAVGIGTTYKLTPFVSLDLRYFYQYNNSVDNTNQILVGIIL